MSAVEAGPRGDSSAPGDADLPTPRVIETRDDTGRRVRVLEVEGTYESATYLEDAWAELVFPYHRLFDRAFDVMPGASRVLMLGGGGCSWPKHVIVTRPRVTLDVVEVDPSVIELARESFYLDRLERLCDDEGLGRLRVIRADAMAFLRGCDRTYDIVANDAFVADDPLASLATPGAIDLVRAHLSADGCYMANVVAALEGDDAEPLHEVCSLLSGFFEHILVIPCGADEPEVADNNVVIATDVDVSVPDALRFC